MPSYLCEGFWSTHIMCWLGMHSIFFPQSKSKLIFKVFPIKINSNLPKSVMRHGSGMQTRTLTFAELLKEPEFLHFFPLVPGITNACPTHPSPIFPFSFFSQHYPRLNTHLKRILVLVLFAGFFLSFPISLPYFLMTFFMKQCYFKHRSSLPSQGPSGFPNITAAEKRDQVMIPSE